MDRPHSVLDRVVSPSVIICYLDLIRPIVFQYETNPPLVIDPDAEKNNGARHT